MDIQIPVGKTDDPDFVELLNCLLRGLTASYAPHEIWVLQIDNWFDHKWLRFSGLGIVDFNWSGMVGHFDAALDEFRQDKLTFPPFPPNRVLGQWSFLSHDGGYTEIPLPTIVHPTERQRSQRNLQRRVQNFSPSACFLWYSGNSQQNGKASVMQYGTKAGDVASWFASFARRDRWKLQSTKGISQKEIHELLSTT